ncbi:hypothetical protein KQX54_004435 [Cotesia glomerata]|uniref:Uncharacterized protein n=1 Tax=Cotesia glomerata TaxID=32391 RepID=A0AAV7HYN3_COTGL|nr:hypothetical protein KQX54_004435 [Cotesia glomerata]
MAARSTEYGDRSRRAPLQYRSSGDCRIVPGSPHPPRLASCRFCSASSPSYTGTGTRLFGSPTNLSLGLYLCLFFFSSVQTLLRLPYSNSIYRPSHHTQIYSQIHLSFGPTRRVTDPPATMIRLINPHERFLLEPARLEVGDKKGL